MNAATTQDKTAERKKVKTTGVESLEDVARIVLQDARVLPLLCDLNPTLAWNAPLPNGTVVVCPSKAEAQRFAHKMGFSLGFNPMAANGTGRRKQWSAMQGGGRAASAPVDGLRASAERLLAQGMPALEVARKLAPAASQTDVEAFVATAATGALRHVQAAVHALHLLPRVSTRFDAVREVLGSSVGPKGLLRLLLAAARDPQAVDQLLAAVLVAPALRQAISAIAPRVATAVREAERLAALDRGARDVELAAAESDVVAVTAALIDHVEPLAGDRARALGIDAEVVALDGHLRKVMQVFADVAPTLPRAQLELLKALVLDSGAVPAAPKPWPLVFQVLRALSPAIAKAPVAARDNGLAGLVARAAAPAKLSVLAAQARVAAGARTVDEGLATAERLAPIVVQLLQLWKPSASDSSASTPRSPGLRRMQRRAILDEVMIARGEVSGPEIAALVAELLRVARTDAQLGAAAARLDKDTLAQLARIAEAFVEPMTLSQRPLSAGARAIVVAAMALDRELASMLSRTTGREAFTQVMKRHAGRVLSKASVAYQG